MEKKTYIVLTGTVPFGGKNYTQGMTIVTTRDLESETKYANRVRLMDGGAVLPPPNKRETPTPKSKLHRSHKKTKYHTDDEVKKDDEVLKEGD